MYNTIKVSVRPDIKPTEQDYISIKHAVQSLDKSLQIYHTQLLILHQVQALSICLVLCLRHLMEYWFFPESMDLQNLLSHYFQNQKEQLQDLQDP